MERLIGLLHLCRKAGKLLIGQKAALSFPAAANQPLLLLANDAGSALKRKMAGSETITIDLNSEKIGAIFDREKISVLGIADSGFAAEIKNVLESGKHIVI